MMRRIIVPLDGSTRAEGALLPAAHLARSTGGSLFLVRATMLPMEYACISADTTMILADAMEANQKGAQDYLNHVLTFPCLEGLGVSTRVVQGDPATVILEYAQQEEGDLIVLGRHGKGGAKRWLLGSVAQKVARHSPVPVLIFREEDALDMFSTSRGMSVLVPLDGSALAEEALQPAIELSHAFSASDTATLHLLCVLPLFVQDGVTDKEGSPLMHETQRYLKELEERLLRECPPTLHLHLTSSLHCDIEVAQAILDTSEKGYLADQDIPGCECIAMATHGRKSLARWAMGSITERVLSETKRPLLIVRPTSIRKAHSGFHGFHEVDANNGKTQEEWQQPFVGLF